MKPNEREIINTPNFRYKVKWERGGCRLCIVVKDTFENFERFVVPNEGLNVRLPMVIEGAWYKNLNQWREAVQKLIVNQNVGIEI